MWGKKRKGEALRYLSPDRIDPLPVTCRKSDSPEAVTRLAQSVARFGILQPILVRKKGKDYQVIFGDRRLHAAKLVGLESVPCRVIEATPRAAAELYLAENLVRRELDLFQEAEALDRMLKRFRFSGEELALHLGMSPSHLAGKLRLLRFSPEEREWILRHRLSEAQARALLRIRDPETRRFAVKYVAEKEYGLRQTESFLDNLLEHPDEFMISLQAQPKPRAVRRPVVRDVRLFCNSVDHAIDGLRSAGFDPVAEKSEGDGFISYSIRIPKYAVRG